MLYGVLWVLLIMQCTVLFTDVCVCVCFFKYSLKLQKNKIYKISYKVYN